MALVVVGIDGAGFDLIMPWIRSGSLKGFQKLYREGSWGKLACCPPPTTCPNWKCFSTGLNPAKLGVFWWENIDFAGHRTFFPHHRLRSLMEIWDYLSEASYRVAIINTPLTYPPKKVNGFMVSGAPDAAETGYTYPKNIESFLTEEFDYKVHPRTPLDFVNFRKEIVEEVKDLIRSRVAVARYALESSFDFVNVSFFYINNMHHFLWDAPEVLDAWKIIDEFVYRLLGDGHDLMVMSDHGSAPVSAVFYVNSWLEENGLLHRRPSFADIAARLGLSKSSVFRLLGNFDLRRLPRIRLLEGLISRLPSEDGMVDRHLKSARVDWSRTSALASGQGPVYINPQLPSTRREELKRLLRMKLRSIEYPHDESFPFLDVLPAEEFYSGEFLSEAPDLLILPAKGTHIDGSIGSSRVWARKAHWIAENTLEGIFFAGGRNLSVPQNYVGISILDLAPSILQVHDIPIPREMDGRPL
jgi:predicted AlkP superfamily phosphohydrolase/phosphomutase